MYNSFITRGYYFNWCLALEGERSVEISHLRGAEDTVSFFF